MNRVVVPLVVALVLSQWFARSASAQQFVPRLDVPRLSIAFPVSSRGPSLRSLSFFTQQISPAIDPSVLESERAAAHRRPGVQAHAEVTASLIALGAGLTVGGVVHLVRADARASGCNETEDEVSREAEMRRAGWAVTTIGSTMALGAITAWTVQRIRGVAPPLSRPLRVLSGGGAVVVGAASSAALWVGYIFRSLGCFNS